MLFDRQYILTEDVVVETRYRTETDTWTSLAIICIALGVANPNVFFRRFIADNRKRKLLAMLVERKKKNGEFVDLHEVEIK